MNKNKIKNNLKKQLADLFKSMDYISNNFFNNKKITKKDLEMFYNIYQQLGLAWEFLGLQCRHWDGYKKIKEKRETCKICGKVKGTDDFYILLPKKGRKKIGLRETPRSEKTFETKKDAEIINDIMDFHGAIVKADVHNSYKSQIIGKGINIAPERIISVIEDNIECTIDQHLIHISLLKANKKKPGQKRYGGFPWEIKKQDLKHFPVLFDFNEKYELLGLSIFK